jgi:hypothetical protein
MTFRQVRQSCDSYMWLWLTLLLLGIVAFICAIFQTDTSIPRVFSTIMCGLLLAAAVWCVRAILYPFEWEVVVDENQIRWGRADCPDRQQRVIVSQLVRLIHDKSDYLILGDVGSRQLVEIGRGVLVSSDEQRALVEYLRQSFPQLKIETT